VSLQWEGTKSQGEEVHEIGGARKKYRNGRSFRRQRARCHRLSKLVSSLLDHIHVYSILHQVGDCVQTLSRQKATQTQSKKESTTDPKKLALVRHFTSHLTVLPDTVNQERRRFPLGLVKEEYETSNVYQPAGVSPGSPHVLMAPGALFKWHSLCEPKALASGLT